MQGGDRDPFNFGGFGGPFGGFGGPFGGFGGSFGGFGGSLSGTDGSGAPRSMISNLFGGENPFDSPFFSQPFGGMFQPNFLGPRIVDHFADIHPSGSIENHPPEPRRSRGPVIEEIDSDDEKEGDEKEGDEKEGEDEGKKIILGKHGRSRTEVESIVVPKEERRNRQVKSISGSAMVNIEQWPPQTGGYSFQSTVTYGGNNGNYYTSSKTRRIGSDGVTFEESKEANTETREAAHKISRGLHNKGHTVARKLHSDGQIDTTQTLHNLNEDELPSFVQSWNGNAGSHLYNPSDSFNGGPGNREQPLALPSTEPRRTTRPSRTRAEPSRRTRPGMNSRGSNGHPHGGHGYDM